MPIGLKTTVTGAYVAPNLGLAQSIDDDLDAAALAFGSDLMLRIDPRDVRRTVANPTGVAKAHRTAPNGDPLVFRNTASVSVATVPGAYNGHDVFVLGAAATGAQANDLAVYFNSMGPVVAFSVVGVAHFDAAMLGSGFHALISFVRAGSNLESMLAHQYISSTNYLSGFADQGDGGGANLNLDASALVTAGTPFAFVFQVLAGGGSRLFINLNLGTSAFSALGSGVPETGVMKLLIGSTGDYTRQWRGALSRSYVLKGDILDTPEKRSLTTVLVAEMMAYFGVA